MEGEESCPFLCPWGFHGVYLMSENAIMLLMQQSQPTCHVNHLPPYIQKFEEFKKKGVDVIAVLSANDPFVMSGWGRVEGLKDKVCMSIADRREI